MGKKKNENIIWKDRKRTIFGLPWSFTRYTIDQDRLYLKKGFFKTELDEILIYRILDIKTKISFGQKINGVGTIILYSADQSNRTLELKNIRHPQETHRLISDLIESERAERGLIGRELAGAAAINMDHVDGHCDTGNHGGFVPPQPPMGPGTREI